MISSKKAQELKKYLLDNFGLTIENSRYLEEINQICQKGEKDYIFPDETFSVPDEYKGGFTTGNKTIHCNGCEDCDCDEFGSLQYDSDIEI